MDEKPYALKRGPDDPAEHTARLVKDLPAVSVKTVLAGANRKARFRAGRHAFGDMAHGSLDWFTFDGADMDDPLWQPQGLTCSSDGGPDAPEAFLVSWYKKTSKTDDTAQAVRLSFFDPDKTRPKYRHVLLVVPTAPDDFDALKIHAGGIAWYGDFLYVADTTRGFRVFDLRRILDVPNIPGDTEVGRAADGFHALGYGHALPQVGSWRLAAKTAARFSFVAIDRTQTPHLLVSGEYDADGMGRVVRWVLKADGSLATGADGVALPVDTHRMPVTKVQGAVTSGGKWYFSQSRGSSARATLLAGKRDALTARPYPVGPEDLTVWRERRTLWSVTEFERNGRMIFGVPL
ncbi:hypothetical protein GCM10027589_45920 [Actinocorallia lasiicapitis]